MLNVPQKDRLREILNHSANGIANPSAIDTKWAKDIKDSNPEDFEEIEVEVAAEIQAIINPKMLRLFTFTRFEE